MRRRAQTEAKIGGIGTGGGRFACFFRGSLMWKEFMLVVAEFFSFENSFFELSLCLLFFIKI